MALPKIKHPTYALNIPSTKQAINIKPFTVQEEKLLMMAKSSEKPEDIMNAIKQLITNCILEPVDVDKLSTFDIEYLFLKLRAKSLGEVVDLEYKDPETEEVIKFQINLDNVEIKYDLAHTNIIKIQDDLSIKMKYPSVGQVREMQDVEVSDSIGTILTSCIDQIFDDQTVYNDFTDQELNEFINSLPMDAMQKIKQFFDTMPAVEHEVKLKNKQGKQRIVTIRGLNNFFT
jgi:hypothetical protein